MAALKSLPFQQVWITGAAGLIGGYLIQEAPSSIPSSQLIGLTRAIIDLTQFQQVERLFERQHPDLVIHCAALTTPSACQHSPDKARRINVELTQLLSQLCNDIP